MGKRNILLVWPYPFYCCYARSSAIFSSDNGIHEAILFQFLNCCSLFYEKKLSLLCTINFLFERLRSNSLSEGAARSHKKREFWHQIKALLWLLLRGIIFLMCEKKNIVQDSDWKYHSYTCEKNLSLFLLARTLLRTEI